MIDFEDIGFQMGWIYPSPTPTLTCMPPLPDTDLNTIIQKENLLEDIHKRYIFYQLLRATKFIHSGNVIHRDQKVGSYVSSASSSQSLKSVCIPSLLALSAPPLTSHPMFSWMPTAW